MPRCFENGNGDFGPEAFRAIHCAQLSTKLMVKRFHGSRRFIFTGSWSATHVLLFFGFFLRKTGNSPYVALSRARSFKTITVLTNDQQINADGSVQYRTRNIVYSEVL